VVVARRGGEGGGEGVERVQCEFINRVRLSRTISRARPAAREFARYEPRRYDRYLDIVAEDDLARLFPRGRFFLRLAALVSREMGERVARMNAGIPRGSCYRFADQSRLNDAHRRCYHRLIQRRFDARLSHRRAFYQRHARSDLSAGTREQPRTRGPRFTPYLCIAK